MAIFRNSGFYPAILALLLYYAYSTSILSFYVYHSFDFIIPRDISALCDSARHYMTLYLLLLVR
jgi:hypothetical protein